MPARDGHIPLAADSLIAARARFCRKLSPVCPSSTTNYTRINHVLHLSLSNCIVFFIFMYIYNIGTKLIVSSVLIPAAASYFSSLLLLLLISVRPHAGTAFAVWYHRLSYTASGRWKTAENITISVTRIVYTYYTLVLIAIVETFASLARTRLFIIELSWRYCALRKRADKGGRERERESSRHLAQCYSFTECARGAT